MTADDPTRPDPAFPDRPDHPDFRWLSEHVLAIDAASQRDDFTVPGALAALPIDPASLTYFAQNRALMAVNHLAATGMLRGAPFSTRMALRAMLGSAYLDAFTLGTLYGRYLVDPATDWQDYARRLFDGTLDVPEGRG